jgi:purine-nucleoside phosphorylase
LRDQAVGYIHGKTKIKPQVAIVLGSGLGSYTDQLTDKISIPFKDIPGFLPTTVEGHSGAMVLGKVNGLPVVVLQGRLHAYEGHGLEQITFPIRVMKELGAKIIMITNAAGGINPKYTPGDLVMITDHINLTGVNPLVGPNDSKNGPRFPDMTFAYDPELRALLQKSSSDLKINLQEGIYCGVMGPSYETPAEIRMFRLIGADLVGMSTVPEVIVANHCGLKVCALSCVTNFAAGIKPEKLNHDDVKDEAQKVTQKFTALLNEFLNHYAKVGR